MAFARTSKLSISITITSTNIPCPCILKVGQMLPGLTKLALCIQAATFKTRKMIQKLWSIPPKFITQGEAISTRAKKVSKFFAKYQIKTQPRMSINCLNQKFNLFKCFSKRSNSFVLNFLSPFISLKLG